MRMRHMPSNPHVSVVRSSSQSSSSSSHSRPPNARVAYRNGWPHGSAQSIVSSPSIDKELVTIALIAPTILKTKADEDEGYPFPRLPPSHQYPHQPRVSPGKHWEPYSPQDLPVELVYVPPPYVYSEMTDDAKPSLQDQESAYQGSLAPRPRFSSHPMTTSPDQQEEAPIHCEFADVAETEAKLTTESLVERAPEVIVSSRDWCARSLTFEIAFEITESLGVVPSPTAAVPAPSAIVPSSSSLLSPPDRSLSRGRSSSSPMLCSQSQTEQPRGRSITRTSSFSDRSSVTSGSPFGSPSPEGGVGLGIGAYSRDRDRERDTRRSGERGRERERVARWNGSVSGPSPSSSTSPDDQRKPPQPVVTAELPPPASPTVVPQVPMESSNELRKKSSSLSSSSSSSTVSGASIATTRPPPRLMVDPKPVTQTDFAAAPSVPSSSATSASPSSPSLVRLMKDDRERISPTRSPTRSPGNSQSSTPTRHSRNSSGGSRSPTRDDQQGGTLVGRAVEIMSNAGAFLGSFWGAGTQTGVTTP
ncbi:hypothetical protein EDC04DRAFT_3139864 [Pisolithus marmoratus]|nr:hypothetical protein EDC04DRAFT_3139864 [Pisolithus marmoratus]